MQFLLSGNCLLLLMIGLLFPVMSYAETGGKLEPGIDALERQLEMGRHEQLVAVKADPQSVLTSFTTDGCSGGLSIGWEYLAGKIENFNARHGGKPPWESCCVIHDQAYHTGGARDATAVESFAARKKADRALKACVVATGLKRIPELSIEYNISTQDVETLYSAVAALMYRAVRVGGMPCTGLPWRWGYGWPECE